MYSFLGRVVVHGPDFFFPKITRKLQNIKARIYRQETAGSVGEKAFLGGVPYVLPTHSSGSAHGEAAEMS